LISSSYTWVSMAPSSARPAKEENVYNAIFLKRFNALVLTTENYSLLPCKK
jgi:hypothetical protein